MTLTEQYKKERSITENKDYYVVDNKGCSFIDFFWGDGWLKTPVDDIEEVLAPVPSYDRVCRLNHLEGDFIKAHERINKLEKENAKLHKFLEEFNALDVAKENQQLKDLLRECQHMILAYSINNNTFTKDEVIDIVKQIDNAIGETK